METTISEKKQRILEAAARLFRDKGYSATSMRDLASAVQLKASSLYNHIASKEEILQEICLANARRFHKGMKHIQGLPDEDPLTQLEALLKLHIRIATQDVTSVTSFNDEWRHLSEPYLTQFLDMRREYETFFRTVIRKGTDQGVFLPGDESVILYSLISAIRWLYDWYQPGKRLAPADLEEQLIPLLTRGLVVD